MLYLIACVSTLIFILMVCAFIVAYVRQDNTVADTAWGLGFIIAAWASFLYGQHFQPVGYLVTTFITLWGLRLIVHINMRNKGKGEDPRYKKLRANWGAWAALHSFFKVFMLQGLLLLIIAYEILVINANSHAPLSALACAGLVLWIIGFLFESIGDYQLYTFMKNPTNKGQIMSSGLWHYTRHPNYFGEITMWWGIYLMACTAPFGLSAIISPTTITFLLLFVSGIPMAEKMFANNPEFQEYKKRTSMLIPWFAKK
jgi:steroid 5-alpha reductase family enzyme